MRAMEIADAKQATSDDALGAALSSLSDALGLDRGRVEATYHDLTAAGGAWAGGNRAGLAARVLSVSLEQDLTTLRLRFQPMDAPTPPADARASALGMHETLCTRFGAHGGWLQAVESLFLPEHITGHIAAYGSVAFTRGEPPVFTTYLDPKVQGATLAPSLVEEALARIGVQHAWSILGNHALRRGIDLDEVAYVALELRDPTSASISVCVRHHAATPADLAAACGRHIDAARIVGLVHAIRGGHAQAGAPAPLTCHTFTASPEQSTSTVCIPTGTSDDDGAAGWLQHHAELAAKHARRALHALRAWPHAAEHERWVALTSGPEHAQLAVSLVARTPTSAAGHAPEFDPRELASPEAVIAWLVARPLGAHPLLRNIARTVDDATPARQAAAARHMHEAFADLERSRDAHEALGALVAGVVAVRLFDVDVPPPSPCDDLLAVARLVPATREATAAFARGAMDTHRMLWRAMDAAYRFRDLSR
ncbi:MAG: hypothetical protein ABW252_03815 [Polyangiales bacterium]